jgi:hypothetical protein
MQPPPTSPPPKTPTQCPQGKEEKGKKLLDQACNEPVEVSAMSFAASITPYVLKEPMELDCPLHPLPPSRSISSRDYFSRTEQTYVNWIIRNKVAQSSAD